MFRNYLSAAADLRHSPPRRVRTRRKPALALERLEDRTVPANWTGTVSTDWGTAGNWSNNALQGPTDSVVIPQGTTNSPILSAATSAIASLTVNTGATLTLNANLTVNGAVLTGGTVNLSSTTTLTVNNGSFTFNSGAAISTTGTVAMTGTAAANLSPGTNASLPNIKISNTGGVTTTGGAFSVASLDVNTGSLTLGNTLTDKGAFTQEAGIVNLNNQQLQVAGNITRSISGNVQATMPGTTGTVLLNGTAGQTFMDTSFGKLPGLIISDNVTLPSGSNVGVRTGGSGVTLNAGFTLTLLQGPAASFLIDRGNFTDNGNIVLHQLSPNGGPTTALIKLDGTLNIGASATANLTVTKGVANSVFSFVSYGTAVGQFAVAGVTINGNFPFTATSGVGLTGLTVTLGSQVTTDTWTGAGGDNKFSNAGNWSSGAVPGPTDLAVIPGGTPSDPTLGNAATVAGLQVTGGSLTLFANLTVTGDFTQSGGQISFVADTNQLIIGGNVNRTGGTFLATAGTVVFNGTYQNFADTSGQAFARNVIVNSGSFLTVQVGSVLIVGNNFTNNGTVRLRMSSPGSSTPLVIGNNLVEGAGSAFTFTLDNTSAGLTYIFLTFGGTETAGATFSANAGTVNHNTHNITVTT
jgi:hypothetical protein